MASPKLKAVKTAEKTPFSLDACCTSIAESLIKLKDYDAIKQGLNSALADATENKVPWKEVSKGIKAKLVLRGVTEGHFKNVLTTLKWCYTECVRFDHTHVARAREEAAAGLALDLMTGQPKKVKKKGDKGKKKAKTEGTVNHCGHGMLAAMEQEGFVLFLDALIERILNGDVDEGSMDDLKLDLVRDALRSCGFAVMKDGELVASVITEADNEGE